MRGSLELRKASPEKPRSRVVRQLSQRKSTRLHKAPDGSSHHWVGDICGVAEAERV